MNIWKLIPQQDYENLIYTHEKYFNFFHKNFKGKIIKNYNTIIEVETYFKGYKAKIGEKADICSLGCETVIFDRALYFLKEKIEPNVQLIELYHIVRGKCYILNVITVLDCLDENNSKLDDYFNQRYVFKDKINYPCIFKIKNELRNIYVTDEFINIIKNNNITGYNFELAYSFDIAILKTLRIVQDNKKNIYAIENSDNYFCEDMYKDKNYVKNRRKMQTYDEKNKKEYLEINKIIDKLINEQLFYSSYFPNVVSEEKIKLAEQFLGYKLPNSYKWFIKTYGGVFVGEEEILTIVYDKYNEKDVFNDSDIIHVNNYLRNYKRISNHNKLVFISYGIDKHFYFDMSKPNNNGEYPIYELYSQKFCGIDFFDFFKEMLGFE